MSRSLTSLASRAFHSPQRWLALLALIVFSCLDPFDAPVMNGDSTLVIDGWVDTRTQVASVRLSHTKNLRDDKEARYETKALVRVIGEDGDTFALAEISPGIYELAGVALSDGDKCSLHIVLSNGKVSI